MKRYHISPESGEPALCSAKIKCPFASDEEHFVSMADARKAFEKEMKMSFPKKAPPSPYEGTQAFLSYLNSMVVNMEDMKALGETDELEELEGWQDAYSFTRGFMRILAEPYDSNIYNVSPEAELQYELKKYVPKDLDKRAQRALKKNIKDAGQDLKKIQASVQNLRSLGFISKDSATRLDLRIEGMELARANADSLQYQMTGQPGETSNQELLEKAMVALSARAKGEEKPEKAEILSDISTWVASHFKA